MKKLQAKNPIQLLRFILVVLPLLLSQTANAQCGFQSTCSNTNYLNFGMGSNTDAATIEYDNFISSFHSTIARTANGTFEVWGESMANNGTGNILSPTVINSLTYPALTGTVLKAHLGSNSTPEQAILLTTTGLFAWATEGSVVHADITSSSTFQKITVDGETNGLPAGVNPLDVKMIFTTDKTMALVTCSGSVYVLTHVSQNTGTGLTGTLSTANALRWHQVTESTLGNPVISNVVAVRGNKNTLFALKSDGTLWTWGSETYLGNNTAPAALSRATEMTLPSANPIKMIGVTRNNAATYYVLNADGNMYSLGNNGVRQLGDWTTTARLSWVQPRYTAAAPGGTVMDNIHWISPNEHDSQYANINVLTKDSTNYNWGAANGQMLGRGGTGNYDPGIPGGITAADKILAVETGGHTSMLAKKCEDHFGYVGHRINGSMGDGTTATTNEANYTFATAAVFICGATSVDVSITGEPTFGASGSYCNGSTIDLIPTPAGGILTLLSGPASLSGTAMTFNGTGITTVTIKYSVVSTLCPATKTTTLNLLTEDCTPITVTLSGTTSIAENATGVTTLTATLSALASTPTTITLAYTGTASGTDYTASSVTIVIPAGSLTGTVTIDPTDDASVEGSETVIADITSVTGGDGATESGTQTAIVTITDDETPNVILTGTTSIVENATGVTTLTATLSVAVSTPTTITLTYTGTATNGTDYTPSSAIIIIPAGSLTGTVTIDPIDDAISEGNETVIVDIASVTGGDGATESGTQTAIVTIIDDELIPTVTLTGTTSILENATGVTTLTVTLSIASSEATTITVAYTGTATNGTDYTHTGTKVVIPAGSLTGFITIDPTNDASIEGDETVIVNITNVTGGNGATESGVQTATVTITDDDFPMITLAGTTSIAENATGVTTLTATISVAASTSTTITLTYTGTATNGTDYSPSSTTIVIAAGSLTGIVTIDPTDDLIFEGNETVIADITSVTGGDGALESGTQTATVTITDDETAPTVTLTGTTSIAENATGVTTLTATLSVATTSATTITLGYTGTATNGTDYSASNTTIVIPAGSLTGTVTIDPTNDLDVEGDETVILNITAVTGGNGATESGTQSATVTITDDDFPTVTLTGTTSIAENATGVTTLTATLSTVATTATTITLTYTGTATSGTDYSPSSTTIVIPAGSLTGIVTIDPTNDVIFEGNETVIADITSVAGGNGATESGTQTATVTITDDETAPTVTLTGTTSIVENTTGVTTLTATLSVATTTATTITLAYTGTATSGTDYSASSTTIVIPAGSTTGTVTIDPTDDSVFEGDETVIVNITTVTGGNGATESGVQSATVTITDDETAPTVTLTGTTSISENATGVTTLTATLSVATTTATTITLSYSGTAGASDYTASSTTIVIPAGSLTGTVTIDPTDDSDVEGDETITVNITNVTGGNGATESGVQTATVTISDDDVPNVTLTGTTTILENATGVTTLTATLSVAVSTPTTITLTYTGTATNGTDYSPSSTTIIIPAGSLTGIVTIDPTDDAIFEGNETVIVDITSVTGGDGATEAGTQTATVTITDDETTPTVTLTGTTSIVENATGVTTLTATLSVAASTPTTITLAYTGTASNGTDYTASSTTIVIAAGSLTETVTIDPTDDITVEGDETVIVDISTVTGGNGATESGTQQVTVTITDNDEAPVANDDIVVTPLTEDGASGVVSILLNDTDPNGNPTVPTNGVGEFVVDLDVATVGVQLAITTTQGTWTYNPTVGTVTFDPATNFNGTAIVTYQLCDPGNACDNAIISFEVTAVNDAPIVDNEYISTLINTPVSGDLTDGGDSDPDGTPLTANIVPLNGPTSGVIVINTNGAYTYTPNLNYVGRDTVVVSICDAGLPLPAICINDTIFINVVNCDINNPLLDCDGDGVPNGTELTDLTNPNDPCDFVLASATLVPSAAWIAADCDGDGVTNGQEVIDLTNPINSCNFILASATLAPSAAWIAADCDGDGVNNGTEVIDVTDPTNPCDNIAANITLIRGGIWSTTDCDGDGVTNANEVADGTVITNPCDFILASATLAPNAAWNAADCDGDGVTNATELVDVTDPSNNCDFTSGSITLVVTAVPDCDGDGVPNATEITDGTDENDPCDYILASVTLVPNSAWNTSDCDGDGVTNGTEIINGTSTSNSCDYVAASVTLAPNAAWNAADCDGDGVTNGTEVINGTSTLNPCDNVAANITLVRGGLWNAADCDGDGVTNGTEITNGTSTSNPCDYTAASITLSQGGIWNTADCDGDGVTNGTEVTNGTSTTNPCDYVATSVTLAPTATWNAADCDGDGVPNGTEVTNGTSITNPCDYVVANITLTQGGIWNTADCDGDGVTNGTEVVNGTSTLNPCDYTASSITRVQGGLWNAADCDGDGVPNGTEVTNGTSTTNPCDYVVASVTLAQSAIWNAADCDGDGVPNGTEVTNGTSTTNPCDYTAANVTLTQGGLWNAADCDGDGVTNETEVSNGTSTTDPCENVEASITLTQGGLWNAADCDGDGVTNEIEKVDGTNPNDPCDFIAADRTLPVITDCNKDFFIPVGFSPNGDGINDYFVIIGIEQYAENNITILNRWGNKVYESSSYKNDWNGTNQFGISVGGEDLPVGTYFYILDLGNEIPKADRYKKGYIYLSR